MENDKPLTHDQMVARIQAFYGCLRKNYEELKQANFQTFEDEVEAEFVKKRYEDAAELLDFYTHIFEGILYTWIY